MDKKAVMNTVLTYQLVLRIESIKIGWNYVIINLNSLKKMLNDYYKLTKIAENMKIKDDQWHE